MKIIEKNSRFSLYRSFSLSPLDEEVLSFLYLPILKSDAYALYHLLYDLTDLVKTRGYFLNSELTSLLQFSDSDFLTARSLLEGIGLMETFRKEDKDSAGALNVTYLYKVLPPASPKKFFSDVLLKASLSTNVGKKQYVELLGFFKISEAPLSQDYQDVTTKFKDVFSLDLQGDDPSLKADDAGFSEKKYKSQSGFSKDTLLSLLKNNQFKTKTINKSLNDIVSTCILYGLDEKNATDLIIKNTSTDNQFVLKGFIDDARNLNQYRRVNTTSGDDKVYGDSEASRYLEAFNSITPKEYLSLRMNANPPSFMLKELENLKTQSGFSNPIINVVLDYSLKRTKGEFNVSFIEKVAASLSIQGVNSAYDAMVKLDNRDFEVSQIANRKSSVRKDTSKKPSQDKPQTEKTEEELKKQQEDLLKLGKFFKI